jgi:hypothetical protein
LALQRRARKLASISPSGRRTGDNDAAQGWKACEEKEDRVSVRIGRGGGGHDESEGGRSGEEKAKIAWEDVAWPGSGGSFDAGGKGEGGGGTVRKHLK